MAQWSEATVHTNGIETHYLRTGGSGAPVVLAHGLTDNGACWSHLARDLEAEYDLIMPDARGHGQSSVPATGYRTEDRAADLIALIRALKLDRPVIIGHSMGGESAAMVAAHAPELIRGAILEDPALMASTDARRETVPGEWARRLEAEQVLSLAELEAQGRIQQPLWTADMFEPWAQAKHEASLRIFDWFNEPRTPYSAFVGQIGVPTLLVTGDPTRGVVISPETAAAIQALSAHVRVANVAGAGHCIRYEQPDAFTALVRGFLEQQFAA